MRAVATLSEGFLCEVSSEVCFCPPEEESGCGDVEGHVCEPVGHEAGVLVEPVEISFGEFCDAHYESGGCEVPYCVGKGVYGFTERGCVAIDFVECDEYGRREAP